LGAQAQQAAAMQEQFMAEITQYMAWQNYYASMGYPGYFNEFGVYHYYDPNLYLTEEEARKAASAPPPAVQTPQVGSIETPQAGSIETPQDPNIQVENFQQTAQPTLATAQAYPTDYNGYNNDYYAPPSQDAPLY